MRHAPKKRSQRGVATLFVMLVATVVLVVLTGAVHMSRLLMDQNRQLENEIRRDAAALRPYPNGKHAKKEPVE
ncbi:MAG: hypothetical protein KAI66_09280 [Lentisphaeria bacterium]|nr:hypothetical protein [Lentisphaeria bacterium]